MNSMSLLLMTANCSNTFSFLCKRVLAEVSGPDVGAAGAKLRLALWEGCAGAIGLVGILVGVWWRLGRTQPDHVLLGESPKKP